MVPRTGPLSASSALATTSWYQRGKSSAWGVSTLCLAIGLLRVVGGTPDGQRRCTASRARSKRRSRPAPVLVPAAVVPLVARQVVGGVQQLPDRDAAVLRHREQGGGLHLDGEAALGTAGRDLGRGLPEQPVGRPRQPGRERHPGGLARRDDGRDPGGRRRRRSATAGGSGTRRLRPAPPRSAPRRGRAPGRPPGCPRRRTRSPGPHRSPPGARGPRRTWRRRRAGGRPRPDRSPWPARRSGTDRSPRARSRRPADPHLGRS